MSTQDKLNDRKIKMRETAKAHYEKNKELIKEKMRDRYYEHKDEIISNNKIYYSENREKILLTKKYNSMISKMETVKKFLDDL